MRMTVPAPWKAIVFGCASILLAGCSDSIERFSNNYSNPSDADPVYTASIKKVKPRYIGPAYQAPQAADAPNQIVQSPIANAPVSTAPDYSQAYAKTYNQPNVAQAPATQATPAYPQPKLSYNAPKYAAPVIKDEQDTAVADTATDDAKMAPVLKRKKLKFIKGPQPAVAAADPVEPVKAKPVLKQAAAEPAPAAVTGKHYTIAKGDTLFAIGRKYNVSAFVIADANGLPHDKPLPVGRTITIPDQAPAQAASAKKPVDGEDKTDIAATPVKPAPKANDQIAQQDAAPAQQDGAADAGATAPGKLTLRWPVRGRVISGFGPKSGGTKNEGINITAPEGANIQAADAGVVAYAGNELKGYGNLVLIRHADGYVTAYAHAKDLLVKKGDTVKRGDVIAHVGQTGAVASPQLHFEVRKGATALDPETFLGAATASN